MATISQTKAILRVIGDDLLPEDITDSLGGFPTHWQAKDQKVVAKSGKVRIATAGLWGLSAADQMPGDLDVQISEILDQLTDNLDAWQELADNYRIDLYCGVFLDGSMEGLSLSPASLLKLGERNILLDMDIYGAD
ncbi:DUF4279 domain-containing protein [Marinobacter sp. M1N3S26]|uniref:DUF4279 domain-containing protein n=1 Tax=Marinobacter sp. M1N3S26 TaxID=3382299 RepID=UPI00387B3EBB